MTPTSRRSLYRTTVQPAWIAVSLFAAWYTLGFELPRAVRLGVLVVGVALLGLPHGAVDHLALPRTLTAPPSVRWFGLVGLLYLALGGLYAAVWSLAPVPAALAFVAMTWAHWGQGDVWPLLDVVDADHLRGSLRRAAALVIRGGLPMLVPLWSFPERYRAVLAAIVRRFGGSTSSLDPLFLASTRLALVGGLAVLSVLALGVGLAAAGDRRGWAVDAGETALLWWLFLAVPPVFAVGVYFVVWHSLRHVGRLLAVDPRASQALAADRPLEAGRRFVREAAPLTLLSLVAVPGLFALMPNPPTDVEGAIAFALIFIAVLTLPHVVIVTVMDVEQGVWTRHAGE